MAKKILILGAGPAGLGLALKLLRRTDIDAEVTVIEKEPLVGGLTAGFESHGIHLDFGSHRLHPNTDPEILKDIFDLLGPDLLERPRNGRIRLLGRFIKFPLNPLDLLFHLPPSFALGFGGDILRKPFSSPIRTPSSFEDVLMLGLGKTICRTFYFPYAEKLWGLPPDGISPVQAHRRVGANSMIKILQKAFSSFLKLKAKKGAIFYYPIKGFNQIAESMAREIKRLGGTIRLATKCQTVHTENGCAVSINVSPLAEINSIDRKSGRKDSETLPADLIFSTIPLTELCECLRPFLPSAIRNTSARIKYRSMILCYFILDTNRFTPYDAHYFPEKEFIFSRISESKNYSTSRTPENLTGLCAEIPCDFGDAAWNAPESKIVKRVLNDLGRAGLPLDVPIKETISRHLSHVYPVYDLHFEESLKVVLDYFNSLSGLVTLGRQGLFAHDNTHHTIEVAYKACECVAGDLSFDKEKWVAYRVQFEKHVVED